jgi:hypothetical protein
MHPEFGIFEPLFDKRFRYLSLLHLGSVDSPAVVASVRSFCQNVTDPFPDICRLLADSNWRPHLVAAVAVIISGYNTEAARLLWRQIDRGSWVTSQLGVALFLVDPNFVSQARIRLESGCPLDTSHLLSMAPLERHSAADPSDSISGSAKAAATLLRLLKKISPEPSWIQEIDASTKLRELLARDLDAADGIADRWLHRIKEITSGMN